MPPRRIGNTIYWLESAVTTATVERKFMTQTKNQRVVAEDFERSAAASDRLGSDMDTVILGLVGEVGSLVSALKKKRRDVGFPRSSQGV